MGSPRGFRRAPEHGGRKAGCANSAPALAFPLPPRRFLSRLGPPPPLCLPLRAGRVVVIFRRQPPAAWPRSIRGEAGAPRALGLGRRVPALPGPARMEAVEAGRLRAGEPGRLSWDPTEPWSSSQPPVPYRVPGAERLALSEALCKLQLLNQLCHQEQGTEQSVSLGAALEALHRVRVPAAGPVCTQTLPAADQPGIYGEEGGPLSAAAACIAAAPAAEAPRLRPSPLPSPAHGPRRPAWGRLCRLSPLPPSRTRRTPMG
ncbi:hypothetical protein J1605_013903 [Eschrichtius robustus]|uniref:Uncharacterized protein n=1 Tax=Eschrichtius robustus TaxID=9764 RepID=A0AB34GG11_ESCRO|nr:hypothetical protein J1605_013903 [Eschrichtius robustus]